MIFLDSLSVPKKIQFFLDHEFESALKSKNSLLQDNKLKPQEIEDLLSEKKLNSLMQTSPVTRGEIVRLYLLGNLTITNNLEQFLSSLGYKVKGFLKNSPKICSSGFFFYPENGYMSWHTNHDLIGYRIYIVKSLKGDSFFRYYKNGKIFTSYDPVGYSLRIFPIKGEEDPFWHCVFGGSGRYSIGFCLEKNN
jgi:hypothetical protein